MSALRIAVAGLLALAVAMGIGRFAFTPVLPMMLHDGVVDLAQGSWLASANYFGYLAGAVLCTLDPTLRRWLGVHRFAEPTRIARHGLVATALLAAAMALPWPATWPTLRFAAGVVSAYVLLHASGWCLAQLAARGRPALGGVMFAGPGVGIVGSGLLGGAMVAASWRASGAWLVFGAIAGVLTFAVWRVFRREAELHAAPPAAPVAPTAKAVPTPAPPHGALEVGLLAIGYGLAGFGYIITATFLPVIARAAIPGSPLIDLFWPLFGAGIVTGALLASRIPAAIDRRLLLALAYAVQAAGVLLGVVWPGEVGFAVGSAMLGLPFTAITLFALQEARRLRPVAPTATMGLITTLYALGQLVGPTLVAALLHASGGDAHRAFQWALAGAAGALLLGGALFAGSARAWPLRARDGPSIAGRAA